MIPKRFEPYAFSATLSCMMSFIISGVSTYRALGLIDSFMSIWIANWLTSWAIAFPVVTVVAPLARRLVSLAIAEEKPQRSKGTA
ncbi:DUF2798 domain-containing protein [Tropicimonas sp. TH_r6]|uniref:DUF2798 domain-containing protein n=1 Tax=Tropicimonas sp. TH_r6 TaxID=3082085 RepID=UPI002952D51A|nr:DUF2798 domain-containing protein [Tropicimonas sp. TH_r6]MDV7144202.1 DUF2798 domain-containing protein [Tropicimonas sp. TH_r6]